MERFDSKKLSDYPIILRSLSEEDGGGFLAEVPDLPGCMADGSTEDEAIAEVHDAMKSWLKTAEEAGDPIPKASISNNYSGQWSMRAPKHLHAALALQAKEEGVSLNMLAVSLLAEGLGKKHFLSKHSV